MNKPNSRNAVQDIKTLEKKPNITFIFMILLLGYVIIRQYVFI